jgi:hypothetical protein
MSSQQKPLTNDEKLMIINSYAAGIGPSIISQQIGKSAGSIRTFYCRWKLNSSLPPKLRRSRSKIDGRMGLLIKTQLLETPRYGLKKIRAGIKEKVSENV